MVGDQTRKNRYPENSCPKDIVIEDNNQFLCEWLCKLVSEARKENSVEYTPCSLYLILAGLQRCVRKVKSSKDIKM